MDMAIASSSCSDSRESLVPPASSRSPLSPAPVPAQNRERLFRWRRVRSGREDAFITKGLCRVVKMLDRNPRRDLIRTALLR